VFHVDTIGKKPEFAVAKMEVVDVGGGDVHEIFVSYSFLYPTGLQNLSGIKKNMKN
jgi:hypothetical protein